MINRSYNKGDIVMFDGELVEVMRKVPGKYTNPTNLYELRMLKEPESKLLIFFKSDQLVPYLPKKQFIRKSKSI